MLAIALKLNAVFVPETNAYDSKKKEKKKKKKKKIGRCTLEKRRLDKSDKGELGHKKKEKNQARYRDNTAQRNRSWKLVAESDRVKSTGTG